MRGSLRRDSSIGPIQQLDGVGGAHGHGAFAEAGGDLEEAARIAGNHNIGACRCEVVQLAIQELPGDLMVQEVIDAGAAAAEV